jgi:hypothetical protein
MPAPSLTLEQSAARITAVPWYVWSAVLAVTSTTVGLYWDISWHTGIGRDTFWTPAHLAIQFGAVLTGLYCEYLILHTTFSELRFRFRTDFRRLATIGYLYK